MKIRRQTLKKLAALVWLTGVAVLLIKSSRLFMDAHGCGAGPAVLAVSVSAGVIIGWVKARFMFETICMKNLTRIDSLEHPRIWQFYRKRFFVFLFLMISLGRYLSAVSQGNRFLLLSLAVTELSIAVALGLSSRCFKNVRSNRICNLGKLGISC